VVSGPGVVRRHDVCAAAEVFFLCGSKHAAMPLVWTTYSLAGAQCVTWGSNPATRVLGQIFDPTCLACCTL
jgi:hypothetical protein